MSTNWKSRILAAVLAAACAIVWSASAEPITYKAKPGGKISIDGTSTVHDWTVTTGVIGGEFTISSSYPLDPAAASLPDEAPKPTVKVRVPTRSLKSGKKRMDEVMHKAMNAAKHKFIDYALTKMTVSKQAREAGQPLLFDTAGKLTINGVIKDVAFPVAITSFAGDRLKISGKTAVKMTDFNIKPPAPKVALGLIKTGDEVKLDFNWIVARKK